MARYFIVRVFPCCIYKVANMSDAYYSPHGNTLVLLLNSLDFTTKSSKWELLMNNAGNYNRTISLL